MSEQDANPTYITTGVQQPEPARFNLAMFQARRPQDWRCGNCGRLLGRFVFFPGMYAQIKCGRCSHTNVNDVAVNSTSSLVLVDLLDHLNGSTPPEVVAAAVRIVEKHGDKLAGLSEDE